MSIYRWLRDLDRTETTRLPRMTRDEVQNHIQQGRSWIILFQKVYDVEKFMKYHPGGENVIKQSLGDDATEAFVLAHRWVDAGNLLQGFQVGYLAD